MGALKDMIAELRGLWPTLDALAEKISLNAKESNFAEEGNSAKDSNYAKEGNFTKDGN